MSNFVEKIGEKLHMGGRKKEEEHDGQGQLHQQGQYPVGGIGGGEHVGHGGYGEQGAGYEQQDSAYGSQGGIGGGEHVGHEGRYGEQYGGANPEYVGGLHGASNGQQGSAYGGQGGLGGGEHVGQTELYGEKYGGANPEHVGGLHGAGYGQEGSAYGDQGLATHRPEHGTVYGEQGGAGQYGTTAGGVGYGAHQSAELGPLQKVKNKIKGEGRGDDSSSSSSESDGEGGRRRKKHGLF